MSPIGKDREFETIEHDPWLSRIYSRYSIVQKLDTVSTTLKTQREYAQSILALRVALRSRFSMRRSRSDASCSMANRANLYVSNVIESVVDRSQGGVDR